DAGTSTIQNPLHIYADTGMYNISLTVWNSGCSATVSKSKFVTALPPVARFTPVYNCNNKKQVNFTDQSVLPQTWSWDFGDGTISNIQNPIHTYTAFGNYIVTLTVSNGSCSNTKTISVNLINEVTDFFTVDSVRCRHETSFFTLNNINFNNISNTTWDFGDGSVVITGAGVPVINHTYNTAGLYTVKVITTDIRGCKDSLTKTNYVHVWGPVANFNSSPVIGCKGLNVNFTDLSTTDGTHALTNWTWTYDDGQAQTLYGPPFNHIYNSGGNFYPTLKVQDSFGCIDSFKTTIPIFITSPKADFNSLDTLTCIGKSVSLTNSSVGINLSYLWNLGNGNTSVAQNPFTVYSTDGNYNIQLIVTDINGCRDTLQKNNYIKVHTAKPSFTVNDSISSCLPFEVIFTNTSVNTVNQTWDFGDGTTSGLLNPSHYYSAVGIYVVKLYVTGPGGCADSVFKTIRVYSPAGTLTYSPLAGCAPLTVIFHASTAGPVTYLWDLDDGNTLSTTDSNLVYNYLLPGNFIPKVILKDQTGCLIPVTGIDSIQVTKSNVNFAVNDSLFCDKGLVNFSDSTISNGIINAWQWNFGDGTGSAIQSPSHNYTTPGLYTVRLVVTTANGCSDTLVKTDYIKVVASPLIGITGNNPVCMPGTITFKGIVLQPDTSALVWNWNFGNGNSSSLQNPLPQQYDTAGSYPLQLVAINSSGCTDTAVQTVIIYPLPVIDAGADKVIAVGTSVALVTTGSPVISYLWTPTLALSCSNCPAPVASPKNNTTYRVLVKDANGCFNHDDVTVIVTCNNDNVFIPNTFSPNKDGVNDIFYPRGKGLYQIQSMRIFNRWGVMVFLKSNFYANDASAGWDGTYHGKAANIDVYTYTIEIVCDNSAIISFKGNIALIQ
ncbi:MAG: PKD domain-containing protein, partial [Ferruginibacter sp.]